MIVSCWCGETYEDSGDLAQCPSCGEPSCLPKLTDEDINLLRADLDLLLDNPELVDENDP